MYFLPTKIHSYHVILSHFNEKNKFSHWLNELEDLQKTLQPSWFGSVENGKKISNILIASLDFI